MAPQPGPVAVGRGSTGDDQVAILANSCHRQVGLNSAALVEPLRVDHPTRGHVDVVGTDPIERAGRVWARNVELGEGGLVEKPNAISHRVAFLPGSLEPVLFSVRVLVTTRGAFRREPVGPLPTRHLTEHGTGLIQLVMQR